jgi:hypothetical protein
MKKLCWALALFSPLLPLAQSNAHALQKIWETDTVVAVPESVLPDAKHTELYVSLIDGGPWDVDGKGGVGRLSLDGKHYNGKWISGLNAPKGLGRFGNRLFVADVSEVVVIDIAKGAIEKKIAIPGASGLNDITVDDKGLVYVSDSKTGKLWRIEKDVPGLYMDNLPGINGLMASKRGLYILAKKAVLLADANKNVVSITTLPNGGDGVEEVGNGDLIVSEWLGIVYYVYADGRKEVLLDTHEQKRNTADIHYDAANHILYVPGFNTKTVSAYKLVANKSTGALLPDRGQLDAWRQRLQAGDPAAQQLVNRLRKEADRFLDLPLTSVMDKGIIPPGGSKHDYMSQAPYFWYDSSKPNGLPYIRRDGERNPEINRITDHHNLAELGSHAHTLTLAWYLTGDVRYAEKAAGLLRHWFLDDATRMNPNLEYGEGIPGINTGRGIGIIETIPLIGIAGDAILLEASTAWIATDAAALRNWYRQYLGWMLNSKNGGEEHQIAADGRMPDELARTNGLGYSTYNLAAFFTLARLADHAGVDLWHYRDGQQAGIRTAFDWLSPYALGKKKWEYQQIGAYNKEDIYPLLLQAYSVYADQQYLADARLIHPQGGNPVADLSWGR